MRGSVSPSRTSPENWPLGETARILYYSVPIHRFGYHAAVERDAVGLGAPSHRRVGPSVELLAEPQVDQETGDVAGLVFQSSRKWESYST